MTKRNLKKLLALGMAAMMTVSTGVTTFAANTDDNLVVTGDTLYSTQIQSGKKESSMYGNFAGHMHDI